jgi:hypothetical protein
MNCTFVKYARLFWDSFVSNSLKALGEWDSVAATRGPCRCLDKTVARGVPLIQTNKLRGPQSPSEIYRLIDRHLSTNFSANFCG